MPTPLLRPIAVALAHEARRRQQLPPLNDLPISDADALLIARREELSRAQARLGRAIDRAVAP